MSNEFELSPANQELERALGGLKPASPRLDRDLVMYRAGQASVKKNSLFWPVISGALSVLLGVSWMVQFQSQARILKYSDLREAKPITPKAYAVESSANSTLRIAEAREPMSDRNSPGTAYLELRNRVLKRGLDGLPGERTGGELGPIETWRAYRTGVSDDAEI
jgi:hypothetical protein